jgi:hypothetical protein
LDSLAENFTVLNLREYARNVAADIPTVKPNFSIPSVTRMRSVGTEG